MAARLKAVAALLNAIQATRAPADIDLGLAGTILQACQAAAQAAKTLAEIDLLADLGDVVADAVRMVVATSSDPAVAMAAQPLLAPYELTDVTSTDWRRLARQHAAGGDMDAAVGTFVNAVDAAISYAEVDIELGCSIFQGCLVEGGAALDAEDCHSADRCAASMAELSETLGKLAVRREDLTLARIVSGLAISAVLFGAYLGHKQEALGAQLTAHDRMRKQIDLVTPLAQALPARVLLAEVRLLHLASRLWHPLDREQCASAIEGEILQARDLHDADFDGDFFARIVQIAVVAGRAWLASAIADLRKGDRAEAEASIRAVRTLLSAAGVAGDNVIRHLLDEWDRLANASA